jgi:deferrochelatase/peroxidase EfeB
VWGAKTQFRAAGLSEHQQYCFLVFLLCFVSCNKIETDAPAYLSFAAFDLSTSNVNDLMGVLRSWTAAAALTAGHQVRGEAGTLHLPASSLTLTFGFGPGFFDSRFGLSRLRPTAFEQLPPFATDQLDGSISDGDLMVQACSDDNDAPVQAVQYLSQLAAGVAALRWQQAGYRSSTEAGRIQTFRNLLGFKDGTGNPQVGTRSFDSTVWVSGAGQPRWLHGGTFLCVRRIRTSTSAWNHLSTSDQEVVIGRTKTSGAPLSGGTEFSSLRLDKLGTNGQPAIPTDSHVRLASKVVNRGATMLRRGYSYRNGVDALSGLDDEGLLFLAYVRDVKSQFVAVQERLAAHDRLNAFVTPVGSAVFAVPPGSRPGEWVGQSLFS